VKNWEREVTPIKEAVALIYYELLPGAVERLSFSFFSSYIGLYPPVASSSRPQLYGLPYTVDRQRWGDINVN